MKPYLSIIISAYNESENIKKGCLDVMWDYLKKQEYAWEMIIVNDGSSDNTSNLLHQFSSDKSNIKIIDNTHQGKASGVLTGGLKAAGEVVLFTDLDQATPISELPKLLDKIKNGFDIAIGSRSNRKGAPLFRYILAYGNVILRTLILRLPFMDTQCGFKAIKMTAAKKIFTLMRKLRPMETIVGPAVDPGFDVELLYLGRKWGYKICEVPVIWHHKETRRVRFWYDMISGIKGLLLVRWRSMSNSYELRD
jgi:glycosyltransferase involved in cell wall biosynthesis